MEILALRARSCHINRQNPLGLLPPAGAASPKAGPSGVGYLLLGGFFCPYCPFVVKPLLQMAVILYFVFDIELSGAAPFEHCFSKGIQKCFQSFRQIKLRIGHKAAMLIDEGDQIRLFLPGFGCHHRTVHHIALPQVVGLCLSWDLMAVMAL
jgi:hypothetical protein